jgi:hypothetical protein
VLRVPPIELGLGQRLGIDLNSKDALGDNRNAQFVGLVDAPLKHSGCNPNEIEICQCFIGDQAGEQRLVRRNISRLRRSFVNDLPLRRGDEPANLIGVVGDDSRRDLQSDHARREQLSGFGIGQPLACRVVDPGKIAYRRQRAQRKLGFAFGKTSFRGIEFGWESGGLIPLPPDAADRSEIDRPPVRPSDMISAPNPLFNAR